MSDIELAMRSDESNRRRGRLVEEGVVGGGMLGRCVLSVPLGVPERSRT
jgi:hypothetical protein